MNMGIGKGKSDKIDIDGLIEGVGVNLAVSFSCIVGCPICKIYLVDHGYRKFKEKIHFMEQYR